MPKVLIGFAVLLCLALPASAEQSELAAPTELSPFITPVKPPPVNLTEPGPANGEEPSAPGARIILTLENDRFAGDSDRHYTHGTRLAFMSAPGSVPEWLNGLAEALPLLGRGEAVRLLLEVGQSIFTPETLGTQAPPTGERPYVGWLYLGLSVLLESEESLDRIGLLLGTLGPAAFAGSTQETVHGLLGMENPEGWHSQPASRPGFVLLLDRFWRLIQATPEDTIQFEVLPHAGLAAGNVFSHGSAGVLIRIGSNLSAEALPAAVAPGLAPGGARTADDGGFRWSIFLDLTGRAVANNVAVEGLDGEGPRARPLVGDVTAGLTLSWSGLSITYARTLRTAEAEGQTGADSFGGVTISVDF